MAEVFGPTNGFQRVERRSNALAGRGSHPKHECSRSADKVLVSSRDISRGSKNYDQGWYRGGSLAKAREVLMSTIH